MNKILIILSALLCTSCFNGNSDKDIYYGRCNVDVIRLSSQTSGIIDSLTLDKGDVISKGQTLAKINTDRLYAQLKRQDAQLREMDESMAGLRAQLSQVSAQLRLARDTYRKTQKMVSDGAATSQKEDELETQVLVLEAQLSGIESQIKVLHSKKEQLLAAREITQINLRDSQIESPVEGIVINKFKYQGELASPGMVIMEVADLSEMDVTIYVSLADLGHIKIGQQVRVMVDGYEGNLTGTINWIASQSEFTPKTILTKDVRTTLVYAVRVKVPNQENVLKIGMPVDISL